MDVFINSSLIRLKKEGANIIIKQKETKEQHLFHPGNVDRLWLNDDTKLDGKVLSILLQNGCDIVVRNNKGIPLGYLSPFTDSKMGRIRKRQLYFSISPDAARLTSEWIHRKQVGKLHLIQKYFPHLKGQKKEQLKEIVQRNQSRLEEDEFPGVEYMQEAYFARMYWQIVGEHLPKDFRFERRSRQPAQDPFNACINYTYGILYSIITGAIKNAGLDPYIGFLHKEADGKPVLAFDVIEPYRCWADEVCLELFIHDAEISKSDFHYDIDKGCIIQTHMRQKLVSQFMDMLSTENEEDLSCKDIIFKEMKNLALLILDSQPNF